MEKVFHLFKPLHLQLKAFRVVKTECHTPRREEYKTDLK